MVNDKPPEQLIVYPEQAGIYNQSGEKMGETNKITVVYLKSGEEVFLDSVKRITMYGWVWSQSIDSNSALKFDENIRYWSNSHIIARLKSGTFLDTIYTNEKKSWKLVSVAGFIPANLLINQDEYNDISWFKRKFSNLNIIVPVTKRMGGVAIQPSTRPLVTYSSLKWQFRLGFLVVSIAVVIRILVLFYIQRSKADKTRRTVNLIVLFAAGFLSGVIFGL